ncbi:MAG: hypothetical protein HRU26_03130, partial [Psychroserpens sp.]|nr:hypothetical protein [Psychroserpens sp.]
MNIKTKLLALIFSGICAFSMGQEKEQHIYLADWEIELNGDEQCQKFLETQVVDKKTAQTLWSSIDLVFQYGKLVKAYDNEEGSITERPLNDKEIGLEYQNIPPNKIYNFV